MYKNSPIQLTTKETHFEAGSKISLRFSSLDSSVPMLYCSGAYGSTVVSSTSKASGVLYYQIPSYLSHKSGILKWCLTTNPTRIQGQLEITSKKQPHSMETYLGSPSILAGGTDFTSIVVIPTDSLDNPLNNNTRVTINHQYLNKKTSDNIKTDKYIAYKKISSPNTIGRIILSSESFGKNSKEYSVDILPGISKDFTITAKRHHSYADGNQILSINTSVIKDAFENIVSDGTYVEFFIHTKKGVILKTSGTTIQGIATARIVHPEQEDYWTIKAYVQGISESDTVQLKFKQAITDFNIVFSKNNRTIRVGPITSFMEQMIPDGLAVQLTVIHAKKIIQMITKSSFQGFATFELQQGVYKNSNYTFKIHAAGITKQTKSTKIW